MRHETNRFHSCPGCFPAIAAYCGFYLLGAAPGRDLLRSKTPELAWLKKEFDLSDAELARITELHQAYRPHCVEMCRRIDAKNAELKELLARTSAMTPEVEQKLAEAAQLTAGMPESHAPAFSWPSARPCPPNRENVIWPGWRNEPFCRLRHGGKIKKLEGFSSLRRIRDVRLIKNYENIESSIRAGPACRLSCPLRRRSARMTKKPKS